MANSIQNPEYKILSTLLHRSDKEYNRILHNGHFKDREKLVTVVEVTVIWAGKGAMTVFFSDALFLDLSFKKS